MEDSRTKEKKNRNLKTSLIVFGVILFLILGVMFYLKNIMPAHLMGQGKKYLEIGNYDKALKMFNMAADASPADEEPIYYKAMTLAKMPPSYETQKELYEIAQLEDCEEASQLAEDVLLKMRKYLEQSVGPNYIDNVLYEDQLIRWNNSEPITYYVSGHVSVPQMYNDVVKRAFVNWQTATNGEISFREVQNPKQAKINVTFVDDVVVKSNYDPDRSGNVIPTMKDVKLLKMEISLKNVDKSGKEYTEEKLLTLAQHEIGHALGLWGHSADTNDIMYYSGDYVNADTYQKEITQRDINTLLLIYKMIPDVIDKPLTAEQYQTMFYHNVLTTYPGENFELEIQRLISQLRNDRQNIIVWVDLAINYAYKKQYPRSNYILNKVFPLVANDLRNQHVILYNLAANYYKMDEYERSERYLNHAINIQDDLDTQILESFLDLRLGRENLAREKLELLNKNYPDHIEIALKLATVYNMQKEQAKAKEVIEKLIKENPKALKDRRVQKYQKNKKNFMGSTK